MHAQQRERGPHRQSSGMKVAGDRTSLNRCAGSGSVGFAVQTVVNGGFRAVDLRPVSSSQP
jgi:hypothetical protein